MRCPNCDKEVLPGWKTCPYCKYPLTAEEVAKGNTSKYAQVETMQCPNCKAIIQWGLEFCPFCKYPLMIKDGATKPAKMPAKTGSPKANKGNTMQCPNCGKVIQRDWKFCPFCKHPIIAGPVRVKKKGSALLRLALMLVAIAIVGSGVVIYVASKQNSSAFLVLNPASATAGGQVTINGFDFTPNATGKVS